MEEQKKWEKDCGHAREVGVTCFCPWCGKKIPEDSLYCEFCGGYVPDAEPNGAPGFAERQMQETAVAEEMMKPAAASVKGSLFKYRSFIIAGVLLVFFGALFLSGRRRSSGPEAVLFYIKDNSVYGREAGSKAAEPEELSPQYLEKWSSRSRGGLLKKPESQGETGDVIPAYSVSGSYLFYLERGMNGSFDLVRKDLKKGESKTLDSGVTEFLPGREEQVVYRKENGALYCYEETRKTKLAEQASLYRLNEAGDALLWETQEDGAQDIYLKSFLKNEDKTRLERNAQLLDASPDFRVFLIQKSDTVFRIGADGTREKLMEGANQVLQADASGGTFYFLREEGEGQTNAYLELYYYDGRESSLVEDSFDELIWQGREGLIYTRTDEQNTYMMVSQTKSAELGVPLSLPERAEVGGEQLYFLSPDQSEGREGSARYELCAASFSESDFGRVNIIDTGVTELAGIFGEQAYYHKDSEKGIGDLYCEGERLAYDVAAGSVAAPSAGGAVFCIADANGAAKRGTLIRIGTNETRDLSDNVRAYNVISDSEIYILADYNGEKGRGDLLLYNGQSTELLDSDIWGIFKIGNSAECR